MGMEILLHTIIGLYFLVPKAYCSDLRSDHDIQVHRRCSNLTSYRRSGH